MAGENNKDFVDACIDAKLRSSVYTMLPGVITKVNKYADKQVVNVRPTIGRLFIDGKYKEPPEILNAHIIMPSAGGGLLSFPVKEGDPCEIRFSMRDIDNWSLSDGSKDQKPTTTRHYALTDAIVTPGLYTQSGHLSPDPDNVVLKFAGSKIQMEPDGDVRVETTKDLTAIVTGNAVVTTGGDTTVNATGAATVSAGGDITLVSQSDINITASGAINLSSTSLTHNSVNVSSNHQHSGITPGGSNSGPPV